MLYGFIGFKIVWLAYQCFDFFSSLIFRYSFQDGWRSERAEAEKRFDRSAHVQRVVANIKGKRFELEGQRADNFLLRHVQYCHPETVFGPNTTLMAIDDHVATFAHTAQDAHNHEVGPFFYINQYVHAKSIITISLDVFNKIVEERAAVADSKDLILLSNTGRCGSTLLTQLFEDMVPGTVAVSEPEVLVNFAWTKMQCKKDSPLVVEPSRTRLFKNCVRAVCISAVSRPGFEGTKRVIMKPKAHAIGVSTELTALYPDMQHIYLYRHPVEYVKSLTTVFMSLLHPLARSSLIQRSVKMDMGQLILCQFREESNEWYELASKIVASQSMLVNSERFGCLYVANMLTVMHMIHEKGIKFKVVSYHELVERSQDVMKEVFDHLGFDEAQYCLGNINEEKDSQKNSRLSRKRLNYYKKAMSKKDVKNIETILKKAGFPDTENFPKDAESLSRILYHVSV